MLTDDLWFVSGEMQYKVVSLWLTVFVSTMKENNEQIC
jgi:hypothetical protein